MTAYDIVRDTFSRTVVDDWGRADNGTDYDILAGPAANFDVDVSTGFGTVVLTAAALNHRITVPGSYKEIDGYLRHRVSAVATGASIIADVVMRWVDDSNYVAARVEFNTAGNIVAVIYKIVAGVTTTLQTVTADTYIANQIWRLRFQVTGDILRTKLWQDPFDEPVSWTTTGSVSNILGAGRVMLQVRRETSNTNTNPLLSYGDLQIIGTIPTVQVLSQFLNDYEFKFGHDDNAIVLNAGAGSIIPGEPLWDVQKVTGLDLPDVKVSDKEFDGIDGGVVEASNISMRTIRLEGILYAHQDDSLEKYLDQLKANFAPVPRKVNGVFFDPSQKPFHIKAPGVPERFVYAKSIGLKYDWDMARRFNSTPFQIILQAQVPTLSSPALHTVTIDLSGVVSNQHRLQVYNAGNYYGYAVLQFFQIGNSPEVYIQHEEQNIELVLFLGTSSSLLNRPVEVNMRQRTVYIIDTPPVSARDSVTDEGWWRLAPGMNTIVVRTDESNSGFVSLMWRDEWF